MVFSPVTGELEHPCLSFGRLGFEGRIRGLLLFPPQGRKYFFQGEAEAQQRQGSGQRSHRDRTERPQHGTFPSRGSPRRRGVTQEASAPRCSPAGPLEQPLGRGGAARGPAVPWGRLRAQTLGTRRRAGGCHPAGTFPGRRTPQAPGPGQAGASRLRQRGCGCVGGLPSRPLSGPGSRSCSPSPSVWKLWEFLSPIVVSVSPTSSLSFYLSSPSLP